MYELGTDADFFHGSWPHPEDRQDAYPAVCAGLLLSPADWQGLADRWFRFMVEAIERGDSDEAAWRAAWVARYTRLAEVE